MKCVKSIYSCLFIKLKLFLRLLHLAACVDFHPAHKAAKVARGRLLYPRKDVPSYSIGFQYQKCPSSKVLAHGRTEGMQRMMGSRALEICGYLAEEVDAFLEL